jgi:hypothetical protein
VIVDKSGKERRAAQVYNLCSTRDSGRDVGLTPNRHDSVTLY